MNNIREEEVPHEGLCQLCSQEYVTPWYAPNELWNAVMRHPDGREASEKHGFVCPNCFMKAATALGLKPIWCLTREEDQAKAVHQAELAGRIDELSKINNNYRLGGGWSDLDKRYEKGRNDEQNSICKYTFDRLAALQPQQPKKKPE